MKETERQKKKQHLPQWLSTYASFSYTCVKEKRTLNLKATFGKLCLFANQTNGLQYFIDIIYSFPFRDFVDDFL